jgi:hypothetical protein
MKQSRYSLALIAVGIILLAGCTAYYDSGGAYVYFGAGYCEEGQPLGEGGVYTPTPEPTFTPTPTVTLTPTPENICYVRVSYGELNVRNAPGGAWVGTLQNNAPVVVLARSGDWYQIGAQRWVYAPLVACG